MPESNPIAIKTALLSVSDKTGLIPFAQRLKETGVHLISTGGTASALRAAGLAALDVSEVTGFPEIMDGRVKTLHPSIHGGLLARRGHPEHEAARATHNIPQIDLVVVNLYPFEATLEAGGTYDELVEKIDIGGPAMIRAAAKNHDAVTLVVDPDDYEMVLAEMDTNDGATSLDLRKRLARKAYQRTAAYDTRIAGWLAGETSAGLEEAFTIGGPRLSALRYGENPHQSAALYRTSQVRPGVSSARQVQGKALSYNNLNDTDAAFECVAELGTERPAIAIIKHANPCGVALGDTYLDAYRAALRCDPVSAFGGIVALNGLLDAVTAKEIMSVFTEVVIAPNATDDAIALFAGKPNLRLLLTGGLPDPATGGITAKTIAGGLLVQTVDNAVTSVDRLQKVTTRAPSDAEIRDLVFAAKIAKHVKSNTIVYAKDEATAGIGAGQMSRIDAARIAAKKAADAGETAGLETALTAGSVAASDAFFPFADGLETVIEAGATAVIQPGGSMRDDEVIAAANAAGIAMVFTGTRHFRH